MMPLIRKIIRKCFLSNNKTDDGVYPRAQVSYMENALDVTRMSVYGIDYNPKVGALGLMASINGRSDDVLAFFHDPVNRFKDLKPGEVQVGSPETKTSIKFPINKNMEIKITDSGDLVIEVAGGNAEITVEGNLTADISGTASITCPTVTIDGDLVVTGTITGQTDVLGGGAAVSLSSHTHPYTDDGSPSTTGTPT